MSWTAAGRAVLAASVLAYVVIGPAARHLGLTRHEALPGWFMFKGGYVDTCRFEFYVREGGVDRRVRASEVIGKPRRLTLHNPDEVQFLAVEMCGGLPRGTDLRADAWCGRYKGWVPVITRDQPLCAGRP